MHTDTASAASTQAKIHVQYEELDINELEVFSEIEPNIKQNAATFAQQYHEGMTQVQLQEVFYRLFLAPIYDQYADYFRRSGYSCNKSTNVCATAQSLYERIHEGECIVLKYDQIWFVKEEEWARKLKFVNMANLMLQVQDDAKGTFVQMFEFLNRAPPRQKLSQQRTCCERIEPYPIVIYHSYSSDDQSTGQNDTSFQLYASVGDQPMQSRKQEEQTVSAQPFWIEREQR